MAKNTQRAARAQGQTADHVARAAASEAAQPPPQPAPTVGQGEGGGVAIAEPAVAAANAVATPEATPSDGTVVVMAELPLRDSAGYATTNLGDLPRWAAREIRNLAEGLMHEGMRLESGREVRDSRDAVVWFCEQLRAGRERR